MLLDAKTPSNATSISFNLEIFDVKQIDQYVEKNELIMETKYPLYQVAVAQFVDN